MSPLIGAIAAGNCILLKPSNQSKETKKIIEKLIHETFSNNYISVVKGPGTQIVTPLIENYIIENIQFGGGCINHLISHVANPHLPFGGIGLSGMGKYHSKYTFDTFSHEKSIFKSGGTFDTNILYPPYKEEKLKLAKKFL